MKRLRDNATDKAAINVDVDIAGDASNNLLNTNNTSRHATAAPITTSVRTTGRVKKPKLVFDPSDNYIARASRVSNATLNNSLPNLSVNITKSDSANSPTEANAEQQSQKIYDSCAKCGKSHYGSGHKNNFLSCKSCTLKWHYSCVPTRFESAARKKFRCEMCRTCCVCLLAKNCKMQNEMAVCSSCADAYHLDCHVPGISRPKLYNPKWKCKNCNSKADFVRKPGSKTKSSNVSVLGEFTKDPKKSRLPDAIVFPSKDKDTSLPNTTNITSTSTKTTKQIADSTSKSGEFSPKSEDVKKSKFDDVCFVRNFTNDFKKQHEDLLENKVKRTTLTDTPSSTKKTTQSPDSTSRSKAVKSLSESKPAKQSRNKGVLRTNDNRVKPTRSIDVIEIEDESDSPCNANVTAVKNWSVDQVVKYVKKRYPNEAHVFKYQDIDGAALLLLTRQVIIDQFGLKLGPSLRLYELVSTLQNRSDDVTLAWYN